MPHLTLIFGHSPKPWQLDVLVVDVDGVDCLIIEELLQIVRPKILQIEVVAHIPPPLPFLAALACEPFPGLGQILQRRQVYSDSWLLLELCLAQVSAFRLLTYSG